MLTATDIQLNLAGRTILDRVSLELRPGQVTAILGPNGAGKTSLLRILTGEISPDRGNIVINGESLRSIPIKRLGGIRAYLHQESSLDFAFTVMEVVLLGRSPHMHAGERPEDYQVARNALQETDLADRAQDFYTNLSGGEKQRVHLARVLAQIDEPSIKETRYLFLDEPTNNLDLSHQQTINRIVRDLATRGIAVCIVLHDLNQAFQVADHIIVLNHGRLALEGSAETIADSPECEKIFGVKLQRIDIPGKAFPYLVLSQA